MIDISDMDNSTPYRIFKKYYEMSLIKKPDGIEAMLIASLDKDINEVDARFINLKYIIKDEWIFFTNYNSPKSNQFISHDQITAIFFWPSINVQIRMKAKIRKTSLDFSDKHYLARSAEKNALAISSMQSESIKSYDEVVQNYNDTLHNKNLIERPSYWGGYSFAPYYFEFWEGHNSRLNKRDIYKMKGGQWKNYILQP